MHRWPWSWERFPCLPWVWEMQFLCFLFDLPLKEPSRPGLFSLYPWIHSSFPSSIIWKRQGGNARCLCSGEALWLGMEPSQPSPWPLPGIYHDNMPFYFSPFCRLWMGSMSHSWFSGSKRTTEMKALDLKDLLACILLVVPQFPLHLHRKSGLLICCLSDGSTLTSWVQKSLLKVATFTVSW